MQCQVSGIQEMAYNLCTFPPFAELETPTEPPKTPQYNIPSVFGDYEGDGGGGFDGYDETGDIEDEEDEDEDLEDELDEDQPDRNLYYPVPAGQGGKGTARDSDRRSSTKAYNGQWTNSAAASAGRGLLSSSTGGKSNF